MVLTHTLPVSAHTHTHTLLGQSRKKKKKSNIVDFIKEVLFLQPVSQQSKNTCVQLGAGQRTSVYSCGLVHGDRSWSWRRSDTHTHTCRQAPEWNRKHMAISINPFVLGHGCCRQRQGRQSVDAGNYSRKQQSELVHSGRRTKVVLTIS